MSDDFKLTPSFYDWARWGMALRDTSNVFISNIVEMRDPHEIMEELRRDNPDGHALLSEHIVLPERPCS